MIEFLKNIELEFNNPNEEFTAGIHLQRGDAFEMGELGNIDTENPKKVYRLILGFLIFSLTIYW